MRIILVCFIVLLFTQKNTLGFDTLHIKSISIYAGHNYITTKQESLDSLSKISFHFSTLSDVLAQTSAMTIKSYGPGLTSSPSLRGGNAQQTMVLWHGLNIQNNMLGQIDLSSIPFGLFTSSTVDYTSHSSASNNATSGSIVLKDDNLKTKNNIEFGTSVSTLNGINNLLKLNFVNGKLYSNIKVYHQFSENNYKYRNYVIEGKPVEKMRFASQKMLVLMQENNLQISNKSSLETGVWYTKREINVPPSILQNVSSALQTDQSFKAIISNKNQLQNSTLQFRLAYQNDVLNYSDTGITGVNKWDGYIVESEWQKKINTKNEVNLIYNLSSFKGNSNSFLVNNIIQSRQNLSLNYLYTSHKEFSIIANASILQINLKNILPQGKLQFHKALQLAHAYKFTSNVAIYNAYRYPTLNDLFWNPGGNQNLLPEKSICQEFNFILEKNDLKAEVSVFNKNVSNWIIWLPTNGYWSPENIAEVWSRGMESSITYLKKFEKLSLKININYAYVLSTNNTTNAVQDANINKQLIYVPLYKSNIMASLYYKKGFITCNQQYVGYRFTSADNSSFLNPYWITNLMFGYGIELRKTKIELTVNVNNLFNTEYESIAYRPMPFRFMETGINIKL
jgi:iron complex outermembrane receptor protein